MRTQIGWNSRTLNHCSEGKLPLSEFQEPRTQCPRRDDPISHRSLMSIPWPAGTPFIPLEEDGPCTWRALPKTKHLFAAQQQVNFECKALSTLWYCLDLFSAWLIKINRSITGYSVVICIHGRCIGKGLDTRIFSFWEKCVCSSENFIYHPSTAYLFPPHAPKS